MEVNGCTFAQYIELTNNTIEKKSDIKKKKIKDEEIAHPTPIFGIEFIILDIKIRFQYIEK